MKVKFISLASGSSGNCYYIGKEVYPLEKGMELSGLITADVKVSGRMSDIEKSKKHLKKGEKDREKMEE